MLSFLARMCETEIFFANSLLRIVKFEISHADANAKNSHLFAKYEKNSHLFAKLWRPSITSNAQHLINKKNVTSTKIKLILIIGRESKRTCMTDGVKRE